MKNSLKCFLFRSFTGKPYYMNILPICLFYSPKNHLYISENNSFNHQTKFYFAKISKKKAEKLEKEKEKASSELPNEIDLNEYENTLKQEVENYRNEIAKLRSGRLTPDLFDTFIVKAYGEMTPMSQLAQIVPKTATSIVLSVYDESLVPEIMKFLENSDMNFQIKKNERTITCSITGGNTREIKESTLKTAKNILDTYKAKFRKIRANGMDSLKPYKKHSSEDIIKEAETEVHNIFTKQIADLEKVLKDKEKELLK